MTQPKPVRVTVVTAKNRRTGALETRRWTNDLPKYDAIAQMGFWLAALGWQRTEIMITGAVTKFEDEFCASTRNRMIG